MSHDAQREMERHALRNVRGLVDRMERDEEAMRATQGRLLAVIVVGVAIAALVVVVVMNRGSSSGQRTVDIPPPKAGQVVPQGPRAPQ